MMCEECEEEIANLKSKIQKALALCEEGLSLPDLYSQPCADEFVEEMKKLLA